MYASAPRDIHKAECNREDLVLHFLSPPRHTGRKQFALMDLIERRTLRRREEKILRSFRPCSTSQDYIVQQVDGNFIETFFNPSVLILRFCLNRDY